jgi:hypothetical protein
MRYEQETPAEKRSRTARVAAAGVLAGLVPLTLAAAGTPASAPRSAWLNQSLPLGFRQVEITFTAGQAGPGGS